jgi:excisionase family DNA binding protein
VPDQFPNHGEAQPAVPQGRLLNRAETAARLHVSKMTVRRLGAAGMLEEIRVGARAIRITEQSVEKHLTERRVHREAASAA